MATSVPAVSTIVVAADAKWVRDLVKSACTAKDQRVVEVTRGQEMRGVVAQVGNLVFDGSIRTQLEDLRRTLKQ